MLATGWLLLLSTQFYDGHIENRQDYIYKKEDCIAVAKMGWGKFYASGLDTQAMFNAICRNDNNHYDFVTIRCNKNGVCT